MIAAHKNQTKDIDYYYRCHIRHACACVPCVVCVQIKGRRCVCAEKRKIERRRGGGGEGRVRGCVQCRKRGDKRRCMRPPVPSCSTRRHATRQASKNQAKTKNQKPSKNQKSNQTKSKNPKPIHYYYFIKAVFLEYYNIKYQS